MRRACSARAARRTFSSPSTPPRSSAGIAGFADVQDAARVVSLDEIKAEDWTLNISRYVLPPLQDDIPPLPDAVAAFKAALTRCREAEDRLAQVLTEGGLAAMSQPEQSASPRQELESYLWGAATLLRGLIDAGDYKQFVFPLLFFKRLVGRLGRGIPSGAGRLRRRPRLRAVRRERPLPDPRRRALERRAPDPEGRRRGHPEAPCAPSRPANPEQLDGIFGDAPWTNKERLPDDTLKNLIEHFSTQTLSLANVPEDELGNGYEYLIKKFADDSGHTAPEFYTNRTVVHLMMQMLEPQAGESIYDPTCGTGGMLISALDEVKRTGGEYRTLKLYGQERNHMTASIARMNLFLHGVEDFEIVRGDTLADPSSSRATACASSTWSWPTRRTPSSSGTARPGRSDPWGRNFLGTPPQGRADYAFFQHILTSLTAKGRCAILFPHGVLFRKEEQAMRAKLVEPDLVECVLGLGPNLFYNSPMEACVVICNRKKPPQRKGKVIFIDAVNEVTRERAQSFLKPEHQQRILAAFKTFADVPGFAKVATLAEIGANAGNLSIPLYVKRLAAVATDSKGNRYRCTRPGHSGKPMAAPSGSRWMRWWKRWMIWPRPRTLNEAWNNSTIKLPVFWTNSN